MRDVDQRAARDVGSDLEQCGARRLHDKRAVQQQVERKRVVERLRRHRKRIFRVIAALRRQRAALRVRRVVELEPKHNRQEICAGHKSR